MGNVSMKVGPVVAFLMTALNLRLGLWLRHPAAAEARSRRWPGLLLYREMMGLTSASGALAPEGPVPALMRDIHLSDGGHFENLALYELIRRHCRYVLVSDCGADPTVAFDDLGNAFRRVREDFGVDITLDIEPMRPDAAGWSRQHVAVGTIHYSPTDQGIIVYLKPTMTGDEPPDVLQYKTRNTAFPHEGTGDQFYDEAQWESVPPVGPARRGEGVLVRARRGRAGQRRPGPISRSRRATERPLTADWVFAETAHAWGATPAGLVDRILEMTKRFRDLEAELQQRPMRGVLAEVFPEMRFVPAGGRMAAASPLRRGANPAPRPDRQDVGATTRGRRSCRRVRPLLSRSRHAGHGGRVDRLRARSLVGASAEPRMGEPFRALGDRAVVPVLVADDRPDVQPGIPRVPRAALPQTSAGGAAPVGGDVVRPPQRARVTVLDPDGPRRPRGPVVEEPFIAASALGGQDALPEPAAPAPAGRRAAGDAGRDRCRHEPRAECRVDER